MRITKRERYLKRVQSDVFYNFSWRRCVKCGEDVKREPMHRFRDWCWDSYQWVYLCYGCAPDEASALDYWAEHEAWS